MRMWMVDPRLMCNQHLLGEHVECHMFVGAINKEKNIDGYINGGLVEVHNLHKRHAELANEMRRRGMNHKSPLPPLYLFGGYVGLGEMERIGKVDKGKSLFELFNRCPSCRVREAK